ncbi:MAG: F0F1 ATP synthase subunit gamma, partial [Pseudomonadota bacterium]|nr:F0F1 ATP synthase subunit gamma [Pseudomonadota bacterium]
MPSLKDLRTRITSVKSTQRITSAMKMVAAAKLRRAQEQAFAARPYAERMERMLGSLAGGASGEGGPKLLAGTGDDKVHLMVVMTTDRGLCGGFNGSIMRGVRTMVRDLEAEGKTVKLFGVGRKGNAIMRREFPDKLVDALEEIAKPAPSFAGANMIASKITEMFDNGDFDCCT